MLPFWWSPIYHFFSYELPLLFCLRKLGQTLDLKGSLLYFLLGVLQLLIFTFEVYEPRGINFYILLLFIYGTVNPLYRAPMPGTPASTSLPRSHAVSSLWAAAKCGALTHPLLVFATACHWGCQLLYSLCCNQQGSEPLPCTSFCPWAVRSPRAGL